MSFYQLLETWPITSPNETSVARMFSLWELSGKQPISFARMQNAGM